MTSMLDPYEFGQCGIGASDDRKNETRKQFDPHRTIKFAREWFEVEKRRSFDLGSRKIASATSGRVSGIRSLAGSPSFIALLASRTRSTSIR